MLRRHGYDYQYLAPLAFIDDVPGLGFTLEWALLVIAQIVRVAVNEIAADVEDGLDDLAADIDALEEDIRGDHTLSAIVKLTQVLATLARKDDRFDDIHADMIALAGGLEGAEGKAVGVIKKLCGRIFDGKAPAEQRYDSLDDYDRMFRTIPLPAIAKTFQLDETFAWMRVAGPNPMVLARFRARRDDFPVSDAMYRAVMGDGESFDDAIAAGRVYVADYGFFAGALSGSFPQDQKYFAAPIALFGVPKDGPAPRRMVAVAIQCARGGAVFQPPVSSDDAVAATNWLMAKTVVQTADGNHHEAVSHLGRTHLVVEPFVVATLNHLDDDHPIGRLLRPHFEGTLLINDLARAALIAPGGTVDAVMQGTIDQSRVVAAQGALGVLRDFDGYGLHEDLAARGVDDADALPFYPYRDAALRVHAAIAAWVEGYVALFYPGEGDPAGDAALQSWMAELRAHDGGRVAGIGEDGGVKTASYLARLLTRVVFTASAQHAAVNFPQREIMSYTPAMPLAGYRPAPAGEKVEASAWFALLPPPSPTSSQLKIGQLLGGVYYTQLGQYGKRYFRDARVGALLEQFQAALAAIEGELAAAFPDYPYLRPSRIPQSINI